MNQAATTGLRAKWVLYKMLVLNIEFEGGSFLLAH